MGVGPTGVPGRGRPWRVGRPSSAPAGPSRSRHARAGQVRSRDTQLPDSTIQPISPPPAPAAAISTPSNAATTAPQAPPATVTAGATAAERPRSGGILRQGNLGDLPTLDGNFLNGQSTIYPVWDRL